MSERFAVEWVNVTASGVAYQFFDVTGSLLAVPSSANLVNVTGTGLWWVDMTRPVGAEGIVWTATDLPTFTEQFYQRDQIAAIKAVTDQFVFTVANQVDANALTGGGGATAADVRTEMDSNSVQFKYLRAASGVR